MAPNLIIAEEWASHTGDIAGPEGGQPAHASAFKALQLPNHGLPFTLSPARLSVLEKEPAGLLP